MDIIIGNLSSLFAMSANAYSSTRKTAKGVLLFQSLSQAIYFFTSMVLKGYSGAVQNVVSILRNLAAIRKTQSKIIAWTLTVAGVVLGIVFNNLGWVGLLPVIGNLQYTLVIFRFQDNERAIKASFFVSTIAYIVFNTAIYNFVGTVTDSVVAITTAIALLKDYKNKSREKTEAIESAL